eukprot:GEMP01110099.1.p1 GENE.GEMP01110099.1~~GEMP01110099.1.p1  ORF type:complete len:203 (+),score=49.69 GEMP01110099.1:58-666(+)
MKRFLAEKATILAKKDKSQKQGWDTPIISLLNRINADDRFFTLSSCSGRAYVWSGSSVPSKREGIERFLSTHGETPFRITDDVDGKQAALWVRFEPFIAHIACDSMESADALLRVGRRGFPSSGLLSWRNTRVVVALKGEDFIDAPIRWPSEGGWRGCRDLDYHLEIAVANKFLKNRTRIARLEEDLDSFFTPPSVPPHVKK